MYIRLIVGAIFLLIGVFLQFGFGISGHGAFWGSLFIVLSPLWVKPNLDDCGYLSFSRRPEIKDPEDNAEKTHRLDAEMQKKIEDLVDKYRNDNRSKSVIGKNGPESILKVMICVGILLMIAQIVFCFMDNPQFGAVIVDAVFITFFIFKASYDWPYFLYFPPEYLGGDCVDVLIPMMNACPDNPYFGFESTVTLKRHDGHAFVENGEFRFVLKKKLPGSICAQVQVAHNQVRYDRYPYGYFVVVYPENSVETANNLAEIFNTYIRDKNVPFCVNLDNKDGNIVVVVRKSEDASRPYATDKEDCGSLARLICAACEEALGEESEQFAAES